MLLLGASGAGKSTLLHGLAGVLGGADEGEAQGSLLIDGADPVAARGRAGLVLQDPDSQVILARVGDDVAFGCENLGIPREDLAPGARSAGCHRPRCRPVPSHLAAVRRAEAATGPRRRHRDVPGLLLLDEPTANLDPAGVIEVRDAVDRVVSATDATLVVVEHRVDVWLPVVDRVIVLGPEGVVADGRPDRVLAASGAELAQEGVWIPGHAPVIHPPGAPARTAVGRPRRNAAIPRGQRVPTRLRLAGRPSCVRRRPAARRRARGRPCARGRGARRHRHRHPRRGDHGHHRPERHRQVHPRPHPCRPSPPDRGRGAGLRRPRGRRRRRTDPLVVEAAAHPDRHRLPGAEHQLLGKTVRDELEVGPRALGLDPGEIADRVGDLLDRLRLRRLERANPYTLSGGEKRRLTVAAALATRPRVLVLDEPTFGQDARTWAELATMLAQLAADGSAIVTVTHDEALIEALGASRFALDEKVAI